jgi:hypothetical protein
MLAEILRKLEPYSPVVVGTFPLGIAVDESDIDIICEAPDVDEFTAFLVEQFSKAPGFTFKRGLASLDMTGTRVEIYGESRPVYEQNGYRHMIIEGRLLRIGSTPLREKIRELKRSMSTEEAFASALGLQGDPYKALLTLEEKTDRELRALITRS